MGMLEMEVLNYNHLEVSSATLAIELMVQMLSIVTHQVNGQFLEYAKEFLKKMVP